MSDASDIWGESLNVVSCLWLGSFTNNTGIKSTGNIKIITMTSIKCWVLYGCVCWSNISHFLRHDLEVLQCIVGCVGVGLVFGCAGAVADSHR